jgi:hypothetical protein
MTLANIDRITRAGKLISYSAFVVCLASAAVAAERTVAVFPFEIERGTVIPGAPQKLEAEEARLAATTARLRELMDSSDHFHVIDATAKDADAAAANLQACGNCASRFAADLGADIAVTGFIHKVSELILSINVNVHEAGTARALTSASVDLRGNTDESWRRGIDYLWKNLLSKRMEALPK